MDFEQDLFISFSHIDNQSLSPGKDGWITYFHKALEIRLSQLRGAYPRIWRDPRLQGNDYFSDTIFETLSKTALLISILSPRYLKSEWCIDELQQFCQMAAQTGGLRIGDNKARLFKVIKTYLPRDQHPPEFESFVGYDFFEFDDAGRPQEFDKIYGPEQERKFYARLNDLAYDIHQTLELLEALPTNSFKSLETLAEANNTSSLEGKAIYLAETTYDLREVRDNIRRELTMAGHVVLPTHPLPFTPDFTHQVMENLAQCDISVHLISPQESVTEQTNSLSGKALQQLLAARSQEQIEIATNCGQDQRRPLSRILWMPPIDQNAEANNFLQSLQNQPDFLSTPLEVLKTVIQERLTQLASLPEPELTDGEGMHRVYLDCDQRDLDTEDIEPLYDWLEQRFQVILPDYESSSLRQSEARLKQCEAVLIYYGQASGLWLKRRLLALKKTLYERPRPLLTKAIYVAGPVTPTKQGFSDPEVPVIDGLQAFNPSLLEPFLAPLTGEA